jgi:hypothetical protein
MFKKIEVKEDKEIKLPPKSDFVGEKFDEAKQKTNPDPAPTLIPIPAPITPAIPYSF